MMRLLRMRLLRMKRMPGTLTASILIGVTLHAGAQQAKPVAPPAPAGSPVASTLAGPAEPDYVIGADDVLSIVYWKNTDLSSEVTVRPDGKFTLPLLNDVQADGLTPAQLRDRLIEQSRRFVAD